MDADMRITCRLCGVVMFYHDTWYRRRIAEYWQKRSLWVRKAGVLKCRIREPDAVIPTRTSAENTTRGSLMPARDPPVTRFSRVKFMSWPDP